MTRLGVGALGLMLAAVGFVMILTGEAVAVPVRFQRFLDRTGSTLLLAGAVTFIGARWS